MINFRSISISGVFNHARARAIWSDGLLRIFTVDGRVGEVISDQPIPMKGIMRAWHVHTDVGEIVMKGKCMTCGGRKWWRIYNTPTRELWSSE